MKHLEMRQASMDKTMKDLVERQEKMMSMMAREFAGKEKETCEEEMLPEFLARRKSGTWDNETEFHSLNVAETRHMFDKLPQRDSVEFQVKYKFGNEEMTSIVNELEVGQTVHAETEENCERYNAYPQRSDAPLPTIAAPAPSSLDISLAQLDGLSVSMDESMSTSDFLKSPDVKYLDSNEIAAVDSIEKKTSTKLRMSDHVQTPGIVCKRDLLSEMVSDDDMVDVDGDLTDPQACATIACDIYKHLRASEAKKRPSTDFMERVQKDINGSMRAILIDWLVEVTEEYRLVPETLYLTVNYIDRYLSGNVMDRQRLQLLGVACMMIASKYEEICAPQVEEFCYITDNTYFKDEVLEMESAVLNYLKFEMTAPTTKCFLRRFVRAAQGLVVHEAQSLQLECLANYIAELSLLEYTMLCHAPSLVAASTIFLAKYILVPSKRPWNSTLRHYTLYQSSDLHDCVMALHSLCCSSYNSSLPAIREKYSQHKYKFVAKKYCPPSIPPEFFQNVSS